MPNGAKAKRIKANGSGRPRRRRRLLWWVLTGVLVLTALVMSLAVLGYFLLLQRPADYQPRRWSADPQQRTIEQKLAERWGWERINEFNNNSQRMTPFTFRLEQDKLNDYLLIDYIHEQMEERWPSFNRQFRQVQFRFDADRIDIMGQVDLRSLETVMTVSFAPRLEADGALRVALTGVTAGALPVPQAVIDEQLDHLAGLLKSRRRPNRSDRIGRETRQAEQLLDLLTGLLGDLIENRNIILPAAVRVDADRKDRIRGIRIEPGYLELDLEPYFDE